MLICIPDGKAVRKARIAIRMIVVFPIREFFQNLVSGRMSMNRVEVMRKWLCWAIGLVFLIGDPRILLNSWGEETP